MACNGLDQRRHFGGNQLNLFPAAFNGCRQENRRLAWALKGSAGNIGGLAFR